MAACSAAHCGSTTPRAGCRRLCAESALKLYGHDLNYGRSKSQPPNLRQDVGGGGVFYSWPGWRNIRPYGKFEMGFGNEDFEAINSNGTPRRVNQTRTVTTLGGGVELLAFRSVWVRVDYGYEFWPNFFYRSAKPVAQLNPQGFTVGTIYHLAAPFPLRAGRGSAAFDSHVGQCRDSTLILQRLNLRRLRRLAREPGPLLRRKSPAQGFAARRRYEILNRRVAASGFIFVRTAASGGAIPSRKSSESFAGE